MDNKISLAVSRGGLRLLRNLGFGLKTFQSKIESNGSSFREKNARPVDNCALLIIPKKNEEKETYSTSVVPVTKWILVVVLTNNYKLLKNAIFSLVLLEFQLTRIRSLVPFPYGIDWRSGFIRTSVNRGNSCLTGLIKATLARFVQVYNWTAISDKLLERWLLIDFHNWNHFNQQPLERPDKWQLSGDKIRRQFM